MCRVPAGCSDTWALSVCRLLPAPEACLGKTPRYASGWAPKVTCILASTTCIIKALITALRTNNACKQKKVQNNKRAIKLRAKQANTAHSASKDRKNVKRPHSKLSGKPTTTANKEDLHQKQKQLTKSTHNGQPPAMTKRQMARNNRTTLSKAEENY